MRLTRHSSDSTAFEAPVNSSQHGVSTAGQLVIRFWAVTSWPCDELTGTPPASKNFPGILITIIHVKLLTDRQKEHILSRPFW